MAGHWAIATFTIISLGSWYVIIITVCVVKLTEQPAELTGMFVKSNFLTNANKLPECSKPQCPREHYQRVVVQTQTRTRLVQPHLRDTCVQGYSSFLIYACGPSLQSGSHSFLSQFSTSSGSCYGPALSSYRPLSQKKEVTHPVLRLEFGESIA